MKPNKDKSDLMPGPKELVGSQALMSWVRDAVATVQWSGREAQFQGFSTKDMMALEVYCCAKGAAGSEEMEAWISRDPVLHGVFATTPPKALLIMAFRKTHRAEIQRCLSRVLDIALKARFGDDDEHQTPIDYCVVRGLDSWFNPRCGSNSEQEANERVRVPDWTDNVSDLKGNRDRW